MSALDFSPEVGDAILAGIASLLDAGSASAFITLFSGPRPDPGAAPGSAVALATIVLAKPATSLVDHHLVYVPADASGALVMAQGDAVWGRCVSGANVWVWDADVTGPSGAGPIKVQGASAELPTRLYAGAVVRLVDLVMA